MLLPSNGVFFVPCNAWHMYLLVSYRPPDFILNESFVVFEFFSPFLVLLSSSLQTKPTLIVVTLNKIDCIV